MNRQSLSSHQADRKDAWSFLFSLSTALALSGLGIFMVKVVTVFVLAFSLLA